MFNIFKRYRLYGFIAFSLFVVFTVFSIFEYDENQKNRIKTLESDVLECGKQIELLKKNSAIDTVNSSIKIDANRTIEELDRLKKEDLNETYNSTASNDDILGGVYFKSR